MAQSTQSTQPMQAGGVILCGGQSSRMGLPKAMLPFGTERMLQRVYRLLSEVVQPIVVVAAQEQELPGLPPEAILARDERPSRGPLEGLRAGLRMIRSHCELVYVTSCDLPLLEPAFVKQLLSQHEAYDAVAPRDGEFFHPLSAVYRTSVLPVIEVLLVNDQLRTSTLLQQINTRFIPVDVLRATDPKLRSLWNLNEPADYYAALESAGLSVDPQIQATLASKDQAANELDPCQPNE